MGDVEEAGMTPNGSGGCNVGTAALEDAPCSSPAPTYGVYGVEGGAAGNGGDEIKLGCLLL